MNLRTLASQTLPPLLLLPLFVMPLDSPSLILWIISGIAAIYSLLSLLSSLFRLIRKNKTADLPPFWNVYLRSSLTLGLFVAAIGALAVKSSLAERYTTGLVSALQSSCRAQGRCPTEPEGWQRDGRSARSIYGYWHFIYITNDTRDEFALRIIKATENEICVYGGAKVALREVSSVQCPDTKGDKPKWAERF